MDTWLWIVLALLAITAIWWIAKVVLAVSVPISISGRAYLKQTLRKRGVDSELIPDACVDEFVAFSEKANALSRHEGVRYRADVVRTLDMIAELFTHWRRDPNDATFQDRGAQKNPFREIFVRHGIK